MENKDLSNLPNEVWLDVKDSDGYYKISNIGRIKSFKRKIYPNGEILTQYLSARQNYPTIQLRRNVSQKRITTSIHRLVAESFIPNPNNLPQVNHINANKQDNRAGNLEWMTRLDNMRHAYKLGLFKRPNGLKGYNAKLTADEVREIRRLYKTGKYSHTDLGEKFNMVRESIMRVIKHRSYKDVKDD